MKKFLIFILLLTLLIQSNVFALELTCQNAILIDVESGKVIYEKDAYTPTYPASTTKILTAILALENCNLSDKAKASYNAIMSVPYDGTTAAIQVGEIWTVKQLVEAMMVCSANEAANVLAEHIGGNIESFASMMNSRAKELGAKSTNFVNANGLHDSNHYTTAYDMAIIARHGMLKLPEFKKAAKLKEFSLPDTDIYTKSDRNFINTNRMLIESSSYYYKYATGIKTGYTSQALNCIVTSAEKDGVELIAVVFGAMGAQNRTKDTLALFEYGFDKLKSETFFMKGDQVDKLQIQGAPSDNNIVIATISNNVVHTIPVNNNTSDYTPEININQDLKAPISSGDILGTITYNIEGNTYEYELLASNGVESLMDNVTASVVNTTKIIGKVIFWAILSVIGILVGIILLRAAILTKKQKMRRRRMIAYNSRFR